MLVTDLDGTVLGDVQALERFHAWRSGVGRHYAVVYATGRTCVDVARLVAGGQLPAPTYTIGALGTELSEHAAGGKAAIGPPFGDQSWQTRQVKRVLSAMRELEVQPEEFQSPYKVSYFLERATTEQLKLVGAALSQARIQFEMIYSGERFLDILPLGVSKGATAKMLAAKLGVSPREVIASGDSGNDVSLFLHGFRGVLVGNAETALAREVQGDIYHSPLTHADGVLDGLKYWESVAKKQDSDCGAPSAVHS